MTDDHRSKKSWFSGTRGMLRRVGGSPLARQISDLILSAISAIVTALRNNALLLALVGLTGAISYDSLYAMADRVYASEWVPVLYPLQFDVAAVPAFKVVVDAAYSRGRRWFAGVMCLLTVVGSMYGNVVAHFGWQGEDVLLYVSLWPPFAFSAGVLLMHLSGEHGGQVVDGPATPHRYAEADHPPESSSVETEITPKVSLEKSKGAAPELHAVGSTRPRIPEGPWSDASALTIRRYVGAFIDLNDRAPSTEEVYAHLPAKARADRQASTQIKAVLAQREAAS